MTSEDLKDDPRTYENHVTQKKFRLVDGDKIAWPEWFHPTVAGFTRVPPENTDPDDLELNPARVLEIRLDRFNLNQLEWTAFDTPIEVLFYNPAFIRGGGGCGALCSNNETAGRWSVEMYGSHQPIKQRAASPLRRNPRVLRLVGFRIKTRSVFLEILRQVGGRIGEFDR